MTEYDDSQLLDLLIDGDVERIQRLDPVTRARLEQIREIRDDIRAIDDEDAVAFRPEQIEAAVTALGDATPGDVPSAIAAHGEPARLAPVPLRGPVQPARRFPMRRLAWAAALLLSALILVLSIGRGDQSTVYADVFGTVDVYTAGNSTPLVRDVEDDGFDLEAGMTVKTRGGCLLNIDDRFRCRAGHNTEFVIENITKTQITIDLRSGMFRVETSPPTSGEKAPRFVVTIRGTRITSEGAVYSVQHLAEPGDHMIVDAGTVTIDCGGKEQEITPKVAAYRYADLCPCMQGGGQGASGEFARPLGAKESCRSFPVQRVRKNAFEIARQHAVPILITRKDGPAIDECFGGTFASFVDRSRQLSGLVWLVIDQTKDAEYLASIGLNESKTAVIVDHNNVKLANGPVNHANDMCAKSLCDLLCKARVKCKACPLR